MLKNLQKKEDHCFSLQHIYFSSGFILMIKLFAAGGSKIFVGLICMIVTICFALLAVADSLLMIQVRYQ